MMTGIELGIMGVFVSGVGVVAGSAWKVSATISGFDKKNEKRVERVHTRIDETVNLLREKFVSRDVCIVQHKQLLETLNRIEADIKGLRNGRFNNG